MLVFSRMAHRMKLIYQTYFPLVSVANHVNVIYYNNNWFNVSDGDNNFWTTQPYGLKWRICILKSY